jgi:CubicO group peptidase (beta-lactamase class C family)
VGCLVVADAGTMLEGHVHPDFQQVAKMLRRQIPKSGLGGAAVCVYHRGECVVDLWGGTRDALGHAWSADTLALSYSTTKGVLATLLHILVDRGLAEYDEPACTYWPEFAQAGKQSITIRQLLCHEAGLYAIKGVVDDARRMLDWEHMVEALERSTPVHADCAWPAYHGLTFGWLIGELIQRIAGGPLAQVLDAEISQPLGLDGAYIGLADAQMPRRAKLIVGCLAEVGEGTAPPGERGHLINLGLGRSRQAVDFAAVEAALLPDGMESLDFNAPEFVQAVIPAVNGMFTARSLARLYAALAGGGSLNGTRLLSAKTLARATTIQSRCRGRIIPLPMQWRLGYHRVPTVRVEVPNGFGHFGIGGSGAWADPDRELAVALISNSGLGTPFGDTRIVRVGSAAALAAEQR